VIDGLRALWVSAALLAGLGLGRWSAPAPEVAQPIQVLPRAAEPRAVVQASLPTATACPPPTQAPSPQDEQVIRRAERAAAEGRLAALQAAQASLAIERDPQRKSELIREIAAQKAQDDLGGAWTWLTQHRADPGYAENARNLLYQWSYARPEHVATLLPQVASGEAQTAAAQQLAQLWNKKDPHAYHAWVASLPEGPLKAAAGSPY
jgi:hypothetical protein